MIEIYNEVPFFDETTDSPKPFITPYLLEGENRPCVIVCPGGGYCSLAPHEGEGYARFFNTIGLSAFVLTYRLNPNAHPTQLFDVQRSIRYVRKNATEFRIDPNKILVCGSSAGGHLSAMAATLGDDGKQGDVVDRVSSKVCGAILCYPVISFTKYCDNIKWCTDVLTKGDEVLAEALSIENLVHEGTPPIFIWHTVDDATVDVRHALELIKACIENKVQIESHIYPSGHHGLGLASEHSSCYTWSSLCENWLKVNGFLN